MFKGIRILTVMIVAIILLTGCLNLLEDDRETITEHQTAPYVRPPVEQITVSDYDEFIATVIDLIMEHETNIHLLYYSHEGEDVQAEVQRASMK